MEQADWWRRPKILAFVLAAALAGCAQSATQTQTGPDSLDCLLGPEADRPECENLDDDPERCVQAGGIFDAETQRCIR